MEFRKQKNILYTREASLCFTQKNNFCINQTRFILFIMLKLFFEYKCDLFIYFKNIFYHVTLENIFRILSNSLYFRISLSVTSPFRVDKSLVLVYKKRDKQCLKNYRPFSLLPICGEIF